MIIFRYKINKKRIQTQKNKINMQATIENLRKNGFKVRVTQVVEAVKGRRGQLIDVTTPTNITATGLALCSRKDEIDGYNKKNRKVGNQIALNRALIDLGYKVHNNKIIL